MQEWLLLGLLLQGLLLQEWLLLVWPQHLLVLLVKRYNRFTVNFGRQCNVYIYIITFHSG